jgi:hypothetical protein
MLRRAAGTVSISGGRKYWSGADEMHRAMLGAIPPSLANGGRWLGRAPRHPILAPPRSWSYACDELYPAYRLTADDYDRASARRFRKLIAASIARHGEGGRGRFVDKSQVFSVKMSYVDRLLDGCEPHFVLVTRNPYATCLRAAREAGDMRRYAATLDEHQRFEICVQHWANTMRAIDEDSERVSHFTTVRLEDVLSSPAVELRKLCQRLDLPFSDDMVPAPGQAIPFGTRDPEKWHPLRGDVNSRYEAALTDGQLELLQERIGRRASRLGYRAPR